MSVILLNVGGNIAMFIPIGIIWPTVFRELDTWKKAIAAGVGFSLFIEIFQLPFYERVTDTDDLLMNSLGFIAGYGICLIARYIIEKMKDTRNHQKKKGEF
jgi:glycopeptide antibiotics resistance protein